MGVQGVIGLSPTLPQGGSRAARAMLLPWLPFHSIYRERKLILRLAAREIQARYRGSILGLAWSVLTPIIMLAVYTFVFTVVFQAKWSLKHAGEPAGAASGYGSFAITLFAGLIVFNIFAECINRSPGLVLEHATYVKKVVFPLEILPWVAMVGALFNAALSYLILLAAYVAAFGAPQPSFFLAPLAVVPLVFATIGLSLVLASLGVFIRDIQQVIGVAVTALLFLAPVFYPLDAMPEQFRPYLNMNPLTLPISGFRAALFENALLNNPAEWNWQPWTWYIAGSWALLAFGYWWFQKTKKGFADVI